MAELTAQDISNALQSELAARPGSTYDDLLAMAGSAYGISPTDFEAGWNLYQGAGLPESSLGSDNWSSSPADGNYQSSLIKSLRELSPGAAQAPGVTLRANRSNAAPIDFTGMTGGDMNSPGTLTMDVPKIDSGRTNPKFSYSTADINQALIDEVAARPGSTYDELLGAAEDYGVTLDEFNTAWANMGFTDAGIADTNQDKVINAADLSSQDIANALSAELAARPGSSYQDLLSMANTVYGVSPTAFKSGWDLYSGVPVKQPEIDYGGAP